VSEYPDMSLLGNNLVKTFSQQQRIVGGVVFYAARVVLKKIRRKVLPRTSCIYSIGSIRNNSAWDYGNSAPIERCTRWVRIMNWKGCGREGSWPTLRYYPYICLGGLWEYTKNVSKDSQCLGRDSNRASHE
jgi:hypothetical protein